MANYDVANLPKILPIPIGHQTETGVERIGFDVSGWLKMWPGLELSVWVTLPGASAAHPAANVELRGSYLYWTPDEVDTSMAGNGTVEIMGKADGIKKLSAVAPTLIERTSTAVTSEPPAAIKPWYDEALDAADRAESAAEAAEKAAEGVVVTPSEIGAAVEAYMAEHPVQVDESDPTVPNWAKQPEKPTYTAEEIGALPSGTVIPPAYTLPTASADTLGGVRVGEGLQMTGDVLGVVPEGKWELIETIKVQEDGLARIDKSKFPDGTPYNLSAAKVIAKFFYPIPASLGTAVGFMHGKVKLSSLVLSVAAQTGTTASHRSTCIYQAKPMAGIYDFTAAYGQQGGQMTVYMPSNGQDQMVATDQKIDGIAFAFWQNTIPVGTEIEIMGVRADA